MEIKGVPVREWEELYPTTQKEREMAVKPSGFSPESWGSRGVVVGHDVSSEDWQQVLTKGLAQFPDQPSILQTFYKWKKIEGHYLNPVTGKIETILFRVRLTP